jgi:hypothetical protein
VLVMGEVPGAETERKELNDSLCGGRGAALAKFGERRGAGGEPSRVRRSRGSMGQIFVRFNHPIVST